MNPYLILQAIIFVSILLLGYNVLFISKVYKREKHLSYIYSNFKMFMYFHMLIIVTLTYFGTRFIYTNNDTGFYYLILLFTLIIFTIELALYPIYIYKFYYFKKNKLYKKQFKNIKVIKPEDIKAWSGFYYKKHLVLLLKDNTTLTLEKGLVNLHLMVDFLDKHQIKRVDHI